ALVLLVIALGLALAGTCLRWPDSVGRAARRLVPLTLCAVIGVELVGFCIIMAGVYHYQGLPLTPFLCGSLLVILLIVSYAWERFPWPRTRILAILGVFFLLGAWHIRSTRVPTIDV